MNAKHVLVVEVNFRLRRILGGALERRGYTVSEAATGEEAIIKASNENPKLILLDPTLPDMSGTEAARALKPRGVPARTCEAGDDPVFDRKA